MLVAVLAWVAYGQVTITWRGRYGLITVSFWQCLFGLAGCVPFALAETAAWRVPGALAIWETRCSWGSSARRWATGGTSPR